MRKSLALISPFQWKTRSSKAMMRRGRKRRRQRGDDFVAPEITLDLQIEILTKLPAKSLMRFKCVSKLWSSLIFSRYFSNYYFKVASPPRPPRLYISLVDCSHLDCGLMDVCHNPGNSRLLSLSLSSSKSAFDQDLTIMPGIGGHAMVVLGGLILYTVCRQACIYNPNTRQTVTLPAIKSNIFAQGDDHNVLYFLGHDPVLDQYKVVCTVVSSSQDLDRITSEQWVFLLEVGGSWKRIEFDQPHLPTRLGLCINGFIYYLAFTCMSRDMVFSFDVRSEEFSMIQAPHEVSEFGQYVGFIEYGGKAAIFDYTDLGQNGLVDLWVLEEAFKWSKKSLVLKPCQMHLVDNNIEFVVESTTRNGEVILAPRTSSSPYYILLYDLQKNDLRKVEIRGTSNHEFSNTYMYLRLMDKSESIVHLET